MVKGYPFTIFLTRTNFEKIGSRQNFWGNPQSPPIRKTNSLITILKIKNKKKQSTSPNGTIKACSACVVAFKKSYQIKIHFAIILMSAHRK